MAKGRALNTIISLMVAFLCGGVIGWAYEVFLCGPFNGDGIDLGHGGIGIPFLVIYAAGALAIELVFGCSRKQFNPLLQILACALLCTILEYAAGLLMLHVLGVQTWDYRTPGWDFLATPDGLICFRASLTFGLMGLLQLRAVRALGAGTVCSGWCGRWVWARPLRAVRALGAGAAAQGSVRTGCPEEEGSRGAERRRQTGAPPLGTGERTGPRGQVETKPGDRIRGPGGDDRVLAARRTLVTQTKAVWVNSRVGPLG